MNNCKCAICSNLIERMGYTYCDCDCDGSSKYKPKEVTMDTKDKIVEIISKPVSNTKDKIVEVLDSMADLLLYKNEKYGDSALNPKQVFYKGDSTNSILIRLDDKIGRIKSNTEEKPRVNDVCDIIGYCTLLLISMGVTKKDIAKFKD